MAALVLALALGHLTAVAAFVQLEDVAEALRLNQRKWAEQQIKEYQFVFRRVCFCAPDYVRPVLITVRDGKITMVRYADRDRLPVAPAEFHRYPTVDELFATIETALARQAHRINAIYHPKRGFPVSVFIDYSAGMADEEQGFRVTELKAHK